MKALKGIIKSANMQNTAVVVVEQIKTHPLYKIRQTRHRKFKVDTKGFSPVVGDAVMIVETKPASKDKQFKISEVLQ